MFTRPEGSYDLPPHAVEAILRDPANPLLQIARLVPDGARVLDVGAGNGLLAQVLRRQRPTVVIDGVEPSGYAAGLAAPHYRRFHHGYAQDLPPSWREPRYDFVVLADVMEHVPDPVGFLRQLDGLIDASSRILLTVPNVAFGAVRIALLNGDFRYVDSGILERTHLRFFTRDTLTAAVTEAGLHMEKLLLLQRGLLAGEIAVARYCVGIGTLLKLARDDLALTYQFLAVLGKAPATTRVERVGGGDRHPVLRYFYLRHFRHMALVRALSGLWRKVR